MNRYLDSSSIQRKGDIAEVTLTKNSEPALLYFDYTIKKLWTDTSKDEADISISPIFSVRTKRYVQSGIRYGSSCLCRFD